MKSTLGYPEFLLTSSTVLLVAGITPALAYTLLGLSMFTAFARYALDLQEKAQQRKELDESIENVKSAVGSFAGILSALNAKGRDDSSVH